MFLGSRFHNLMVDGKENLKLSTFVCNCHYEEMVECQGVRQLSGMATK